MSGLKPDTPHKLAQTNTRQHETNTHTANGDRAKLREALEEPWRNGRRHKKKGPASYGPEGSTRIIAERGLVKPIPPTRLGKKFHEADRAH